MTPWERLVREIGRKRKTLRGLSEATGASRQTINHWKRRGIPSKYLRASADYVGRSMDWLELGVDPSPDLLSAVQAIANHLESLGDYDRQTVISLLSTLAHSPKLYEVVANGLESLPKQEP
jgi:hypothetical protein